MTTFIDAALWGALGAISALFLRWCWDEYRSIARDDDR